MNTTPVILAAIFVNLLFGLLVYLTNARRTANRMFLALSFHLAAWCICVLQVVQSDTAVHAANWIRAAFFVAAFFPASVTALHLAFRHPGEPVMRIYGRARLMWALTAAMGLFCLSPLFLQGVLMPQPGVAAAVPEAVYGPGFAVFSVYFFAACIGASVFFAHDLRDARGMARTELEFMMLGIVLAVVLGGTATLIIPLLAGTTQTSALAPLAAVLFTLIVAYGIARYRILDVAQLLRRATAHVLLALFVVMQYGLAWWLGDLVRTLWALPYPALPHLIAAALLALALTPPRGYLHRFASQLIEQAGGVEPGGPFGRGGELLQAVVTMPELLRRFAAAVTHTAGPEHVAILLREGDNYVQRLPDEPGRYPLLRLSAGDPLARRLELNPEPLVAETLLRLKQTDERSALAGKLVGLKMEAAVGIPARDRLEGILLLGPRSSGRIYGRPEQEALQVLCGQLAVALDNARMYTEAENRKIYHEILLDSLVNGVIAANAQDRITVFNREACRLSGLRADDVVGQPLARLPDALARTLKETLATGIGVRDRETVLKRQDEELPLRVSSSVFLGHTGEVMGALLVLSDQTQIRKLEMQVRHTDRLASVGTLSAGMAHEIKNPLVSLKTFTQLLPERYEDPEFRDTFSSLLEQEVARIDSIVNQLLHFARPAKPELAPAHLHTLLDSSLRLVEQPLHQKGIKLERDYQAATDTIQADAALLDQAFVNFFLNAIEAMDRHGQLTVRTEVMEEAWAMPALWHKANNEPHVLVTISDTGTGIRKADLPSIFDPFFSTKPEGTGLGLSVTHGIIQEHGGAIHVESEEMKGTTFQIALPLLRQQVRP